MYFADGEVGAIGADGARVRSVPGGGSVGGLVGMDEEVDMVECEDVLELGFVVLVIVSGC